MSRFVLPVLIAAVVTSQADVSAAPPALEQLREHHRARAAQLRSVLIVRTVERSRPQSEAQLQRLRDRIRHRGDLPLALLLEQADEQGIGPDELEMAVESLRQQLGNLDQEADAAVRVLRINRNRRVREQVLIDFAGKRKRIEKRDVRDLDRLMQANALAESMRGNLDVSSTFIATPQYRIGIRGNNTRATFLPATGRVPLHDDLELLGIVPAPYLSGRYPTEIDVLPNGNVRVRMRYTDSDQLAAEIHLRPSPGYEATYFVRYNRDGVRLHEFRLSDFRQVAPGLRVPFHAETFQRVGGNGALIETHVVQRVQWNAPVDPMAFRAPSNAKIRVLDPESWDAYSRSTSAARPEDQP